MATADQIAKAKDMGWSDRDSFRGDPSEFIDADEFVSRGEKLVPILKANNRKLAGEVRELRNTVTQQGVQLQEATSALNEFRQLGLTARVDRLKAEKQRTLAEKTAAIQADDAAGQTQADDRLAQLNGEISEAEKAVGTAKPTGRPNAQPQPNPQNVAAYQSWLGSNPWYNVDARKTRYANGVAQELRANPANEQLIGAAFYQKVDEEVAREFPTKRQVGKTEPGGNGSGDGGGSGGGGGSDHSYSDLPADAKAACDRQAGMTKMVGKGKLFETRDAYRQHYADQYFKE